MELKPVKGGDGNWLIFHFSADYDSGELITTEEGKFVYLSAEEMLFKDLFPSVRLTIQHILNPKDGTVFCTFRYDNEGKVIEERKSINLCAV